MNLVVYYITNHAVLFCKNHKENPNLTPQIWKYSILLFLSICADHAQGLFERLQREITGKTVVSILRLHVHMHNHCLINGMCFMEKFSPSKISTMNLILICSFQY